jgi:carbon starvation protein
LVEISEGFKLKIFKNRIIASLVACLTPLILIFAKDGNGKPLWAVLWPLFGATNQLLGAIALLVISVYLVRKGKNFWITFIPMIFLMCMTFTSLFLKVKQYGADVENKDTGLMVMKSPLLFGIGIALFALAVWISVEGIRVLIAHKQGKLKDGFALK